MSSTDLIRRGRRAILLAVILIATAGAATMPVDAGPLAQPATDPETILSEPEIIREWAIGGGFVYWYESCRPFLDETHAFLKRRAVNGAIVQTLVDINDSDACETLIGLAVDDSGAYYYNRSAGTIEAIYTHAPSDPPTVLATVGERTNIGFGGEEISNMFLDETHVYWIEVERRGEFIPDEIHIRRANKEDGEPVTLLTYDGTLAGYSMAISDTYIWWIDSEGLHRLPKPPCPENVICTKTLVHDTYMRNGKLYLNEAGEIFWWDAYDISSQDERIFYTRCPPQQLGCQTTTRYTAPESTSIYALVANSDHIYWLEVITSVGVRMRRLQITGGTAQTILEEDLFSPALAIDSQGVYFQSQNRRQVLRLPLDVQAILREISFGGWEVTQAVQSVQNDVPLIAGKQTFIRVYGALDSGSSSAGVEARLHGSRDGETLPDSPLRPLNGNIVITSSNALTTRSSVDGGWLFQLPMSWTKDTPEAIPLEDTTLTLRVDLDPRSLTGDTTPANNSAEETFPFIAKAPTCVNLRSVWTEVRYQSPWDQSVAGVIDLAESAHPTPRLLAFPEYNRLSEIEWCWKGIIYGPFCSGPYELDDDDSGLLTKMGVLDFFHDSPSVCFLSGARTLYAGIVSAEASWSWSGLARRGKDQSLSKVPRYGTWSWPLARTSGRAMTFLHEIGHNYGRKHIDCGGPKNPDTNYPYATNMLDDGPLDSAVTHFGFDTRLLTAIRPDTNRDYMSYCGPRWPSDYTWKAILDNTRPAGPLFPLTVSSNASAAETTVSEITGETQAEAYVLVSGLLTPTVPSGQLSPLWSYPTAEASETLRQKWEAAVAEPWTEQPYHVRVLGDGDAILTDRAIALVEVDDHDELEVNPFHVIFPAPEAPVQTVQLMMGETVLDSVSPGAVEPDVTILAPEGGETVEDTFTLQWTANDPDAAPWLVYTVQYSPDLGENWYSLVAEQPGPGRDVVESLPVDLRGQPGSDGETALLRVLASDGYNTGLATSEPFSVSPRSPDVLITAPEDGQWFAAGEPVLLRGDAFDPEDGVLNDDAFRWSLPGLNTNERTGVAPGLAPGAYTATLQATDSDGQQGSTQVSFQIAPLDVPFVTASSEQPALDGNCDDTAYGEIGLPLAPYATGDATHAALARTGDHLWVCLQGLQAAGDYAGIQVDVDNSQDAAVQAGDLGFFVQMDGTLVALEGEGGSFSPRSPTGLSANVSVVDATWSAELRIAGHVLGGWNQRVALGVGHYYLDAESSAAWPHTATLENPQSWAQTNLGADQTLRLTALSPISTVVDSNVTLTVTGSGFEADTVVLWEGTVLTPTYVDDSTLLATVESGLLATSGPYQVQVAPAEAPLLASSPLPFLVYNPPTVIEHLTPGSASVESAGFTLVVDGAGFVDGATILWNGEERPTSFVSGTRLEAQVGTEDLAAARPVSVTVANPDPSLDISGTAIFTVVRDELQIYLPQIHRE